MHAATANQTAIVDNKVEERLPPPMTIPAETLEAVAAGVMVTGPVIPIRIIIGLLFS